jgi:hypothetical protein
LIQAGYAARRFHGISARKFAMGQSPMMPANTKPVPTKAESA